MVTKVKINWYFVVILLIASASLIESKRGFSIGRSRKKAANPNVRRNNNQQSVPEPAPKNQKPVATNIDNKPAQSPVGPPPAYPGLGHNSAPSNGAPPAYSPHQAMPPSYSAATGNSYSNIGRIPPGGAPQSHYPDATSFHGIGYGHNAYGGPSHVSGLYANNGVGMGGYSGVGTYGSSFGHGSSPFSFGNILTGLALWNVARGFNSYNRPQHVHIHEHREVVNNQNPVEASGDISTPVPEQPVGPVIESSEPSVSSAPTESLVNEEMNFVTYHPSLLTYAAHIGYQPDSVHYFNENTGGIYTESNTIPQSSTYLEQGSTEYSTESTTERLIDTSTATEDLVE